MGFGLAFGSLLGWSLGNWDGLNTDKVFYLFFIYGYIFCGGTHISREVMTLHNRGKRGDVR